jgi:hypothetical protein
VPITGRPAQEGEKFQAAHFRHWVGDVHLPGCEWLREEESDGLLPGETEEAARQRRVRRKLTDFVTIFDPRPDVDDSDGGEVTKGSSGGDTAAGVGTRPRGPREMCDEPGQTRSRDLERLVNSFREAKETLSRDELESLEIRVVNIGQLRLVDYFVPVTRAQQVSDSRVVFGGAWFVKDYGQGFKLCFYDKIDGRPVYFYVSPEQMTAYRYRKYLRVSIVDQIPAHRYVTVYGIGRLEQSSSGKQWNFVVEDLRKLALVLGPQRTPIAYSPGRDAEEV